MDTKAAVEAVLAEVGKAFRLCRFYPATHPTVEQARVELAAALPRLALAGLVELRIGPTGFVLGTAALLGRNPSVQEFANQLYTQGHRAMNLQPGVTAEEFLALIRSTAGTSTRSGSAPGPGAKAPALPHIALEAVVRKSAVAPRASLEGGPLVPEGPAVAARSTGVFRPNALPPEIEAQRLTALLEVAMPAGAMRSITRLGAVASELLANRDFGTCAMAVSSLARWAKSEDAAAAEAARQALAPVVTDGTIAAMIGLVTDQRAAAPAKQAALAALGTLGERAVPALFDAYVAAFDDPVREAYAAAVQKAGAEAVLYLAERAASDRVEAIRAAAALLGSTGAADAVPVLALLARHADAGVRRAAIGSLGRLGGSDAGRLVIAALHDGDPGVRLEAARGAARLDDRGLGPMVMGQLESEPDESVALALIEALGSLQEARAVPALAELARGGSRMFQRRALAVRVAAIGALVRIGTPDALAAVQPYQTDRNPDIRNAALVPGA